MRMCRMTTIFLFYVWICESYQLNNIVKSKIKEIYGISPLSVSGKKPSDSDDSCQCPEALYTSGARNCVCVPYYHCDDRKVVDIHGRGIIDVRVEEDHPCPSLAWCCSLDNVTNTPILPNDHKSSGCGWRKPKGVGFQITGNSDEAEFGEFPWMIAILSYTEEESIHGEDFFVSYKCGGTLIHPQAVITGAHCVSNQTIKYLIRAGEWDSQSTREPYPSQDHKVKFVVTHPDFSGDALLNNIALLLLETPVDMTYSNVGVACLPRQGEMFSGGTRCFAMGWGKDKFGQEGKYQVILKKIELPIMERNICQMSLRRTRLGNYFQLHTSFICAGGELGKDTCKGDGGSPLVCPITGSDNRYQIAGMVSWGIGCGDDGIPGAYANVALFRNWIDQQIINYNLDTSTYSY